MHSIENTVDYLDENGNVRIGAASASLPANGSGSKNGGFVNGQMLQINGLYIIIMAQNGTEQ